MMDGFVLLTETRARFAESDRRMTRRELIDASKESGIEVDEDELVGRSLDSNFDLRYEWEIKLREDAYELIERQYIDKRWLYALLAAILLTATGFIIASISAFNEFSRTSISTGFSELVWYSSSFALALLFASLWLFGVVMAAVLSYSGLIPRTRGANQGDTRYSPFDLPMLLLVVAAGAGSTGYVLGFPLLTGLAGIFLYLLCGVLVYDYAVFEDKSEWLRSNNPLFELPAVAGEYALSVLPAISVLAFIVAGYDLFVGYLPFILGSVFALIAASVVQLKLLFDISREAALDVFFDIKQSRRRETRTGHQVLMFVSVVVLSYLLTGVVVLAFLRYGEFLVQFGRYPFRAALAGSAFLPVLYFGAGMLFQTFYGVKEKIELFLYSTPLDRGFETSSTVLEVDSERLSPASLSTGVGSYIFIPAKVVSELRDRELEAIVAHEEKHIRSGEAFLFLLMPIISLLLVTGQNVIYSLLDFRAREFAADEYSGEQVGEDAVISALEEMKQFVESERENLGWWQRYFGIFYGTFAHSQAHPSVEERIDRLEGKKASKEG